MDDLIVEKVMSLAQRRKRAQQLRRIEPKLVRQRAVKRKRLASEDTIYARAQKLAKKMFRIKFAGQQGAHYQSLSPTQKMEVDRLIDQRGQAIKKLAVRLIPIVRMAEYKRFQALKGKHGEQTVAHLQKEEKVHNNNTEQLDEITRREALRRKASTENSAHKIDRSKYTRRQRFASADAESRTAWRNVRRSAKHLKGFDVAKGDKWTIAQMIKSVSGKSAKSAVRRGRKASGPQSITKQDINTGFRNQLVKDEIEILTFAEVILEDDMTKFNKLMAVGLVDKDKYLQYKKAMSDIRRNAKIASYSEMILNVLDELVEIVTKDPAIYQRVKMAVEKNG